MALVLTALAAQGCSLADGSSAAKTTLTIESWRTGDAEVWNRVLIPAFEADNPNISVEFVPTVANDYNATLSARLADGTAGDIVACRPFDVSLRLYEENFLAPLKALSGMANFDELALTAYTTDDGKTPFCVPVASVISGFLYNADIFSELGLSAPATEAEFFAALDTIAADGRFTPLAMGTLEQWEAATLGFQNIGPNHWDGENGRQALIAGTATLSDQPYVDTFAGLARWGAYLPSDAETLSYFDAQSLFRVGEAAIYPTGSWAISSLNAGSRFLFGAFPAPAVGDDGACHISDHADLGLGLNRASDNEPAARRFLEWVASPKFAALYSNALPGFFSPQRAAVKLTDRTAQTFASWRDHCESTIRNSAQMLSRGDPNLEDELWRVSAGVMKGEIEPQAAADRLAAGLAGWYRPGG